MNHNPPGDLPDEARAKFVEIVGDDAEPLTPMELDAIASYARAHAEEQAALKLLAEMPNPFILAGDGKPYVNPLRSIINQARAQMQRLRRELRNKLPTPVATIGENKRRLLAEIQRRHLAVLDAKKINVELFEHGPLFSAVQWFDVAADDAARMRWNRTMTELIDAGLVIENRKECCKWSNVRLSPEGEAIIEELAASA
jgi:hypothetical protein